VPVQLDVGDVLDVAVRGEHALLVVAAEERDFDLLAFVLVRVVLHRRISVYVSQLPLPEAQAAHLAVPGGRGEDVRVGVPSERTQRAAVGHDQHDPSRVESRDSLDGADDPRAERLSRLAVVPFTAREPLAPAFREVGLDLGGRQARPRADVDLAQVSVDDHVDAELFTDDCGGLVGPPQIARVDGVDLLVPEPVRELAGLLASALVQRRVGVALPTALRVPVRLSVPRQEDRGHRGTLAALMDLALRGKVCVVTGSTRGIGLAAARLLSEEGARVTVTGRDSRRVERARLDADASLGVVADLADPNAPAQLLQEVVEALGPVDCLVNNVGSAAQADFLEVSDREWDEFWQLNVMSYVRAIRAVVPGMRQRGGGVIVNVASTAGKRPSTSMPHYSVTKAAVLSLSRLVADLYAGEGIRCNAVAPGPTATDAWLADGGLAEQQAERVGKSRDEVLAAVGAGRPLGRLAEADEIAAVIAFLCSARASYVTGAAWSADGGTVPIII
jgi:3-oxoacyl-[acyl-carrier protein] reductase